MKTRLAAGRPGGVQCPCRQKKEDSMEQKYFTLDEVAAMLRLTPFPPFSAECWNR